MENVFVQEISLDDQLKINGGSIAIVAAFIAGAIAGGLVYDGVKAAWIWSVERYTEAAANGAYSGMPSPSFLH